MSSVVFHVLEIPSMNSICRVPEMSIDSYRFRCLFYKKFENIFDTSTRYAIVRLSLSWSTDVINILRMVQDSVIRSHPLSASCVSYLTWRSFSTIFVWLSTGLILSFLLVTIFNSAHSNYSRATHIRFPNQHSKLEETK